MQAISPAPEAKDEAGREVLRRRELSRPEVALRAELFRLGVRRGIASHAPVIVDRSYVNESAWHGGKDMTDQMFAMTIHPAGIS